MRNCSTSSATRAMSSEHPSRLGLDKRRYSVRCGSPSGNRARKSCVAAVTSASFAPWKVTLVLYAPRVDTADSMDRCRSRGCHPRTAVSAQCARGHRPADGSRSCARGGRRTYLQSASRPASSSAAAVVAAWSEKPPSATERAEAIRMPEASRNAMRDRARRSGPAGAAPPTAADASAANTGSCSAEPSSSSVGSWRLSITLRRSRNASTCVRIVAEVRRHRCWSDGKR